MSGYGATEELQCNQWVTKATAATEGPEPGRCQELHTTNLPLYDTPPMAVGMAVMAVMAVTTVGMAIGMAVGVAVGMAVGKVAGNI